MAALAWKLLTDAQMKLADEVLDAALTANVDPAEVLAGTNASDADRAAIAAAFAPDEPPHPVIAREAALNDAAAAITWHAEYPNDPIYAAHARGKVRHAIDHDTDEP